MQNNVKIKELKKNLPLGAKILLSKRTGLSKQTINNVLSGKPCRMNTIMKVVQEGEKIVKEYKECTEVNTEHNN